MKTFIPRGSTTHINCTATNQDRTPRVSIRLPHPGAEFNHLTPASEAGFNNLGFYSIPQDDSLSIILLINGTVNDTNNTSIKCTDVVTATTSFRIYETTLVVYGR